MAINQRELIETVCEALDCYEKATERVEISAGNYGSIVLHLCSKCSSKFKGDDE